MEAAEEEAYTDKSLGESNPAFFANHYLNLSVPPHQKAWYATLDYDRHLQLSPREHGKSVIFTLVSPLWHALYRPNYRILIISKTFKMANKFLEAIEAALRKEKIQEDFKEELGTFKKVGNMLWVNRPEFRTEATIEAVGLESAITGGHFDLIIMDDIVDDENTRTPSMRDFVFQWHAGTVGGLLAPGAKEHVVGTRKHPDDIYQRLIDSQMFHVTIDKAIIQEPEHDYIVEEIDGFDVVTDVEIHGPSKVLWDDPLEQYSWPIKKLLLKKEEMIIYFEREFQNNAKVMEGQRLKTEWLHYYTTNPAQVREDVMMLPKFFARKVQFWDLAIGLKTTNDYTVCCTLMVDKQGRCFAKFYRDRIDFPTAITQIEAQYHREKPMVVGIEANQFQQGYAQVVRQRSHAIPVIEVVQTKNKEMKIDALAPFFQNGSIWIDINDRDFFTEYSEFPTSQHDDMLDALEGAHQLSKVSQGRTMRLQ